MRYELFLVRFLDISNYNNSGPSPRSNVAIMHVALGEEVGGATIASAGTPPRMVGVAPPTMGLSNEGRPANRVRQSSNQEASGEKKKSLGPQERRSDRRVRSGCARLPRLVWPDQGSCFGLDRRSPRHLSLVHVRAGWRPTLFPSSPVLGATLWR